MKTLSEMMRIRKPVRVLNETEKFLVEIRKFLEIAFKAFIFTTEGYNLIILKHLEDKFYK